MVDKIGPLDWRIPIVDPQGKPTPEFQRRWDIQQRNNALIGSVQFGSGAPTGTPSDGAEYVDISVTPYTIYIGHGGSWHAAGSASANPTATASDVAVNGSATTFMRSDGAPAVQKASSSQFGIVKVDGTTITSASGVISSTGGSSPGALIPIQTITIASSQASVTFSNIPQGYQDLELVVSGRTSEAANNSAINIQFNSDTTAANYPFQQIFGSGSSATITNGTTAGAYIGAIGGASAAANYSGTIIARIGNYSGSTFYKSTVGDSGAMFGGGTTGIARQVTAQWLNTAAITAITVLPQTGSVNFINGTVITLYARASTPIVASPGLPVIQEVITAGSQTSVTLSNIPQTYRDLMLVVKGRGTTAASNYAFYQVQVNGNTGTIYSTQRAFFTSTSPGTDQGLNTTGIGSDQRLAALPSSLIAAGQIGHSAFNIRDYTNSTLYKSFDWTGKQTLNTTGDQMHIILGVGQIDTTAPITSITVSMLAGGFLDGSVITLYGVGGAVAAVGSIPSKGFPFTIVQEASYSSAGNTTSYTVTFPNTTASTGNTLFMLVATDGSQTVTTPGGWTVDINQQQSTYARFILLHKTSASDTSATFTVSSTTSFSVLFFELSGVRALDQFSASGIANNSIIKLPLISPTTGAAVFAAVANVWASGFLAQSNPISNDWKAFTVGSGVNSQRCLLGHIYQKPAAGPITPPILSMPSVGLFASGGLAYATFSII